MKQPELRKKILELRKAKGLSLEELEEKYKISVRTTRRIETGEVAPRVYTIKSILNALKYDLEQLHEAASHEKSFNTKLKEFLFIELEQDKPSSFLVNQSIKYSLDIWYHLFCLRNSGR